MSNTTIPKTVTRSQWADAWKAFWAELGVDAAAVYSEPVSVELNAISFNVAGSLAANPPPPKAPSGQDGFPDGIRVADHPQGDEYGEWAVPCRIEVV